MFSNILLFFYFIVISICTSREEYDYNSTLVKQSRFKRVIGGQRTEDHHPHQVALYLNNFFFCAGSIIKSNWILTACHCLHGKNSKNMKIKAGSTHRSKGIESGIKKTFCHSKYNPKTYDYDVALIKSTIDFSIYYDSNIYDIRQIKISNKPPTEYENAILSGWGRTRESNSNSPTDLFYALVRILPQNVCKGSYKGITTRMFCAGFLEGKIDACQGDSGGPLISIGGKLIGIVSWGRGCARKKYPTVYTNIQTVLQSWIIPIMKNY